jgi:putative PEP-CTERM system histidine kinase
MTIPVVISYAAAYFSLIVTLGVLLRDRNSLAHRLFAVGMLLFAAEELLRGLSFGSVLPEDAAYWQKRMAAVSVLLPAVWSAFSLSYGRVNPRSALSRWKWLLVGMVVAPVAFVAAFHKTLFLGATYLESTEQWSILLGWPGRAVQLFLILTSVLILLNLEQTVRSATGRLRWQIKFMILGLGGLFALRIYLASQSLLYSTVNTGFITINGLVLIAANLLFAVSLLRGSSLNVDVYLSTTAIQNSLTIILTGIYLIAVGLFARIAHTLSPNGSLPLGAFGVFICLTVLAALLLSNRLRRKLRLFVSRHFRRPVYDYRNVWMELTKRTTLLVDTNELSAAISRMVSDSLEILSVSVWLLDDTQRRLTLTGSTAIPATEAKELERAGKGASEFIRRLREKPGCIDLDEKDLSWPKEVMQALPDIFRQSKIRYAVGLHAGGESVGVMTLNDDRVGHEELTEEDFIFLETVAAQLAASLLNLKLSGRLRHAKEVETFQMVSTFFVHDLKNLASRLSLTMHNLPGNFDNPQFRADALRVISTSVKKIDDMCERLTMLKQSIELKPAECDLNRLVRGTLDEFKGSLKAELKQDLKPVPAAFMDSEQIRKVLTNLVMNANEAVNGNGVIEISTVQEGNSVALSVRDNGCGIPAEFIEKSLFRPFQTTKKKGLGIGLFHCKLIVEAHRGTLEVNSAVGTGTEFKVILPLNN